MQDTLDNGVIVIWDKVAHASVKHGVNREPMLLTNSLAGQTSPEESL